MDIKRARIILTALAVFQTLFNLLAEVNYTHVFNSSLDGHSRFHIVWQLMTDTLLALISVAAMWVVGFTGTNGIHDGDNGVNIVNKVNIIRVGGVFLLIVPVGFILAAATKNSYGGTFFPSNIPEYNINVLGVPVALIVFVIIAVVDIAVITLTVDSLSNTNKQRTFRD